jgi:hypothetical protein
MFICAMVLHMSGGSKNGLSGKMPDIDCGNYLRGSLPFAARVP